MTPAAIAVDVSNSVKLVAMSIFRLILGSPISMQERIQGNQELSSILTLRYSESKLM
jgi:hypothetical protein